MSSFSGPYVRISAPELSFEQRKIMARELTEAISDVLQLNPHQTEALQVQFCSYRMDAMAVGGRLLSETEEPHYCLEILGSHLFPDRQEALGRRLLPLMLELVSLPAHEENRVSLIFNEISKWNGKTSAQFVGEPSRSLR